MCVRLCFVYACAHIDMYAVARMRVHMYMSMCAGIQMLSVYACVCVYAYMYIGTHIYKRVRAIVHILVCTYI